MAKPDRDIPLGWSYNPSTWLQRMPIIVLAILGFAIAGYLSLYQLRVISEVWEPFCIGTDESPFYAGTQCALRHCNAEPQKAVFCP